MKILSVGAGILLLLASFATAQFTPSSYTDKTTGELGYGVADTTRLATGDSLQDSTEVHNIRRDYDHKAQVITGSTIMFCLALVLATLNNYNPRR